MLARRSREVPGPRRVEIEADVADPIGYAPSQKNADGALDSCGENDLGFVSGACDAICLVGRLPAPHRRLALSHRSSVRRLEDHGAVELANDHTCDFTSRYKAHKEVVAICMGDAWFDLELAGHCAGPSAPEGDENRGRVIGRSGCDAQLFAGLADLNILELHSVTSLVVDQEVVTPLSMACGWLRVGDRVVSLQPREGRDRRPNSISTSRKNFWVRDVRAGNA